MRTSQEDLSQSARFIEAAKKAESELSGKKFEKAFKKIVKSKPSVRQVQMREIHAQITDLRAQTRRAASQSNWLAFVAAAAMFGAAYLLVVVVSR